MMLALSFVASVQGKVMKTVEWHDVPPLPIPVSDMSASTIGVKIYLIGGCNADQVRAPWDDTMFYCATITDKCTVFNTVTEQYNACANAPRQRYRHAAVPIDGSIYVVGGRDDQDKIVTQIDVYNPVSDTWTTTVDWPGATSDLAAFTDGTSLFVAGGYDTNYTNAFKFLWKFDTSALSKGQLSVQTMANMTQGRGDLTAVTLGSNAYVSGGWHHEDWCDPLKSVERYDMKKDEWTSIAALGTGRADKAMAVLHGNIFAIGGEHNGNCAIVSGGSVPVNDVEVLDVASGAWSVETKIPQKRFRFVAASDANSEESIFIFGGQGHYNATCDCFSISNDVLRFTHHIAFGDTTEKSKSAAASLPFIMAMAMGLAACL